MHRWDAQHALGRPAEPIEAGFAADAVTEVFELFAPRMIQRGLAAEPRDRAEADRDRRRPAPGSTDPATPVSEVAGTASDLALMLWGRIGLDAPQLAWSGDRAAGERVVRAPLVP